MNDTLDVALVFGFLSFFQLWGGAAFGAGVRARRWLPVFWGLLIGGAPLYFGIERVAKLGSWGGLAWQVGCFIAAALAVGLALPRLRAGLLTEGAAALMIGTFIMCGGAVLGAIFYQRGSDVLSLVVGGAAFMFGAMWFGSGLRQLREPRKVE
jgi:hypothetical protein